MESILQTICPNVIKLFPDLIVAFMQTVVMVSVSFVFSILIGTTLGICLIATKDKQLYESPGAYRAISTVIDIFRAIPSLILITALTPITHFIMGTSIGVRGAIFPLVVASVPFIARQIEMALSNVSYGKIEAAKSMGESRIKIILRVLIPESISGIISAYTIAFVSLINFSAVAGAVGAGGLGDFALRYGYHDFETDVMVVTVVILIVLVMLVQKLGLTISNKVSH